MNRPHTHSDSAVIAVLAIDFQVENGPGERWTVDGYEDMLNAARTVLASARQAGAPVIHSRTLRRSGGGLAAEPRLDADRPLYGDAYSPGAEFIAELAPMAGETAVDKTRSSAFDGTDLQSIIAWLGITDLVVAGVWTEECVLLTVKDAIACGYKVWLAAEACSSGTTAVHVAATAIMAMRLYGGGVVGTRNAVNCLERRPFTAYSPPLPRPLFTSGAEMEELYASMVQAPCGSCGDDCTDCRADAL